MPASCVSAGEDASPFVDASPATGPPRGRWRGSGLGRDVRADGAGDAEREREHRPAGAGPLLPEDVIERQLARADLGEREHRGDQHALYS